MISRPFDMQMKAFSRMWVGLVFLYFCPTLSHAVSPVKWFCDRGPINILFVGNSYVIYNDLPEMLESMSQLLVGKACISAASVSKPAYSLQRHWVDPEARNAIQRSGWHYVVLQDQSQMPIQKAEVLLDYSSRFDREIAAVGAKTILFETWPTQLNPERLLEIRSSYARAASAQGSIIAPVGQVWSALLRMEPDSSLYSKDGSHPSVYGSLVAACTFLNVLADERPVKCPTNPRWGISLEMARSTELAISRTLGDVGQFDFSKR